MSMAPKFRRSTSIIFAPATRKDWRRSSYHNTLDIVTLAALSVELARAIGDAGDQRLDSPLDLFSLSRIFHRAGVAERGVSTCERALAAGLPTPVESHALQHLAAQYKRQRQHERAVEVWLELSRRETRFALEALEELAIHYEHRRRDPQTALEFTVTALEGCRRNLHSALPTNALPTGAHGSRRRSRGRSSRHLQPRRSLCDIRFLALSRFAG